ncbi:unnamed protein product [Symbiodinium necroappetens]|uniref:Uncharacterized protein n=1 Tax=Symbiodinium necroappetens TaxID=1628268 RepID=A0A812QHN3_9DINO|nr:unnamed protein product [Symbiodinium necroappetens]
MAVGEDCALPKRRLGTVQAVLVDFDATLTVREEIPAWRLFPEKGGFDREVDASEAKSASGAWRRCSAGSTRPMLNFTWFHGPTVMLSSVRFLSLAC